MLDLRVTRGRAGAPHGAQAFGMGSDQDILHRRCHGTNVFDLQDSGIFGLIDAHGDENRGAQRLDAFLFHAHFRQVRVLLLERLRHHIPKCGAAHASQHYEAPGPHPVVVGRLDGHLQQFLDDLARQRVGFDARDRVTGQDGFQCFHNYSLP